MGGYLVLLLKTVVLAPEADDAPTQSSTESSIGHNDLPTFVFGADGEFLGRVDVPVHATAEKGA